LQQNAVLNAAKRSAKCCKTQGKVQQNARLNAAKCKIKTAKREVKRNLIQRQVYVYPYFLWLYGGLLVQNVGVYEQIKCQIVVFLQQKAGLGVMKNCASATN